MVETLLQQLSADTILGDFDPQSHEMFSPAHIYHMTPALPSSKPLSKYLQALDQLPIFLTNSLAKLMQPKLKQTFANYATWEPFTTTKEDKL